MCCLCFHLVQERLKTSVQLKSFSAHTLDVIIECEVLVAVFTQQTEGVGVGKILKLDKAVHPIPVHNRNINVYFFKTQETQQNERSFQRNYKSQKTNIKNPYKMEIKMVKITG